MKIAILLPLKENYSHIGAGAVSILVNSHLSKSTYKKNIKIYGTKIARPLNKNQFINLKSNRLFFSNKSYVRSFVSKIEKNTKIIELHNRPKYFFYIKKIFPEKKFILFFHNNPKDLRGSSSIEERKFIYENCDKIVFLSHWIKEQFFKGLKISNVDRFIVFYPGVAKIKKFPKNKKNIILFVGKLNKSKGYDLFSEAISKFVSKNKNWKAVAIGSESRRVIKKNIFITELGDLPNKSVLKLMEESKIAIANSRWEEPLGRLPIEAASRGCFPITSSTGGLTETLSDNFSILPINTADKLLKKIEFLNNNPQKLLKLQKKVFKNFSQGLVFAVKKLDRIRKVLNTGVIKIKKFNKIKILHIASFNESSDGNLFYSTANKINNGFVRIGHFVQTLDDKNFVKKNLDIGAFKLNKKILNICENLMPDLIVIGHSDKIFPDTLKKIIKMYPSIKIIRWYIDSISPEFIIKNKKILLNNIDFIDHVFVTSDPKKIFFNFGKKIHFIPNPVDSSIEVNKNFSTKKLPYDIFFALSHGQHRKGLKAGKIDERDYFVENLHKNLPFLRKYFISSNFHYPKWGMDFYYYVKNSRMGLNISRGMSQQLYSSDRIATLVGNGLLTFIDKKTNYMKFFTNKELVFFSGINDLIKKINFFKNNEDLAIKYAENAYKKYHKFLNSEQVCRFMLSKTGHSKKTKFLWT